MGCHVILTYRTSTLLSPLEAGVGSCVRLSSVASTPPALAEDPFFDPFSIFLFQLQPSLGPCYESERTLSCSPNRRQAPGSQEPYQWP